MTGSMERKRIRPLILAITMVGALLVTLLPMGAAQAQTPAEARGTDLACPEGADYPDFDDIEGNTFEDLIRCLAAYGITQGIDEDSYGPALPVRRDQMASFIARLIRETNEGGDKLDEADDGENQFADVPASNVHRDNIEALADAEVVLGRTATQYDPEALVRRDQMASFIARALDFVTDGELPSDAGDDFFTDDEGNVHETNINNLAGEGIVQGRGGGIYAPGESTRRDQMSAFIMRSADLLIEEGFMEPIESNQATLTVTSTSVQRGGNVEGSITGEGVQSATVSGPCVPGGNVTDTNAGTAGIQFSIPTSSTATAGSCELTFTVTMSDGSTETHTATVTITAPPSQTARPELLNAAIVSTVGPGQATPTNPAGTVVRFGFDEPIGAVTAPGALMVYKFNTPNAPIPADSASVDPSNPSNVLARFNGLTTTTGTTAASTADVSVATTDLGAVTDGQGLVNVYGDAPLGSGLQGSAALTSGRTSAPDVTSLAFRGVASPAFPNNTVVDFVFDQAAWVQAPPGAGQFQLIRPDATLAPINCTGPAETSTSPTSGGTVPGGNGTTTITVVCPTPGPAGSPPLTAANVARGAVQPATVGTTPPAAVGGVGGAACDAVVPAGTENAGTTNRCNPLETSDNPDTSTTAPDLTSTTLQPGAAGAPRDVVLFTFDQQVANAGAAPGYCIYGQTGNASTICSVGGGAAGTATANPEVGSGGNNNTVAVSFPQGTIAANAITGGNVLAGTAAGIDGITNQDDEAGATNVTQPSTSTQPPGSTIGPDLSAVALGQGGTFGTDWRAVYTFDQRVNNGALGGVGNLYLTLGDGTTLQCTNRGFARPAASGAGDGDNQIVCTAYNVILGPQAGGAGGVASNAQVGSATLGSVDNNAITDAGGRQNPEGHAPATGGTGTAQA